MPPKDNSHATNSDESGLSGRDCMSQHWCAAGISCSITPSLTTKISPDPARSSAWAVNTLLVEESSQMRAFGQHIPRHGRRYCMPRLDACLPNLSSHIPRNGFYSSGVCHHGWTEIVMRNQITTTYCAKRFNPSETTTIIVDGTVTAVPGKMRPNFVAPVIILKRGSNDEHDHIYDQPEELTSSSSSLDLPRETHQASLDDPERDRGHILLILLAILVFTLLLISIFVLWKGRQERKEKGSSGQEELGAKSNGTDNNAAVIELDSAQVMELESVHMSPISELAVTSIAELDAEPSRGIVDWEHEMGEPSGLVALAVP